MIVVKKGFFKCKADLESQPRLTFDGTVKKGLVGSFARQNPKIGRFLDFWSKDSRVFGLLAFKSKLFDFLSKISRSLEGLVPKITKSVFGANPSSDREIFDKRSKMLLL